MAEKAPADALPQATKSSQQEAPPAAISFQAPATSSAAAPTASAMPAAGSRGPAATSFSAPAGAAAAASTPASPSKGRKGGKRKGKKAGKGGRRADAPVATSFQVPAEGSSAESEAEEEQEQEQAEQAAAPAEPTVAAGSTNGAAPATGSISSNGSGAAAAATQSGSGSSSGDSGRQVVTLENGTLTVNADGSISISGPDAAKVLGALAAVGVLPAAAGADGGSSSLGAAARRAAPVVPAKETSEVEYLTARVTTVADEFPGAIGADDFIQRVEIALYGFGFSGDNSIAMVNLCRDEVTGPLKQKIDAVFGASFSTNGLGGVLTCGTIGMGAGFSHSPVCGTTGKERYVFFSFPHISINSCGEVGPMSRPGRPGQSCACGALIKAWQEIRSEGLMCNCKIPGVHDAVNPEYSILKQRIARRLRHEGGTDESVKSLTLTDITKVAERTISDDLEFLISKTVDITRADYAVITGVQIHNWAHNFEDDSPNMEFVAPTSAYVVVNGVKTHLDLSAVPPLTPRQIRLLHGGRQDVVCNTGGSSTLREEDAPYAFDSKQQRLEQRRRLERYVALLREEGLEELAQAPPPAAWRAAIVQPTPARCAVTDNSTVIDRETASKAALELKEIQEMLQQRYQQQNSKQ
ncbi:hypothetical protein ABPG75_002984 [Micractinium tetrahymenae]